MKKITQKKTYAISQLRRLGRIEHVTLSNSYNTVINKTFTSSDNGGLITVDGNNIGQP